MKKNSVSILFRLIGLVKPLLVYMILAIVLGVLGFVCANFLTVLATAGLLKIIQKDAVSQIILILLIFAFIRGFLRYGEQTCNHYIAFKLLALIRDHVFAALRKLAPAKLEGKDKGNLISIITSDIELLEVFYAHTIAPIAIAIITSLIIAGVLYSINPIYGVVSVVFYIIIGYLIPVVSSKFGKKAGAEYREEFAKTNSHLLE
ncbi:ABC transporter transmembrane domain-containing protein, partial [Traorella massiliensis]|uniref:ABC transporter transmembrane domain-containing protein n=1 Tax=Traorella massiliensis TaxID=1903263 RepID=UPI00248F4435